MAVNACNRTWIIAPMLCLSACHRCAGREG